MSQLNALLEYPDWTQKLAAEPLLKNPLLPKDTWQIIEDLGLTVLEHHKAGSPVLVVIRKSYIL